MPAFRYPDTALPEPDARALGRSQREDHPRRTLAELVPSSRSAAEILATQNRDRVPELVPLRLSRMLADPFSFYRGSAALMAADLADSPSSGILVLSSGDAHLGNFGVYASPQRTMVFDQNDFDEGGVAPWEWDVKRLVTSAVVGGRHLGHSPDHVERTARETARSYVDHLDAILRLNVLQRYYLHAGPEARGATESKDERRVMEAAVRRARKRTPERAFRKLMETGPDGTLRLRENPPTVVHVPEREVEWVRARFSEYLETVGPDIQLLLSQFRLGDVARRAGGVGSVGTRCYLVGSIGPTGEPLILQIKEANRSVLEEYGQVPLGPRLARHVDTYGQGGRVVAMQRMLQAVSDPFLGPLQFEGRDHYVRQFQDMTGSVAMDQLSAQSFRDYARRCAAILARAHAQSPTAVRVSAYIGKGSAVTDAIVEWSSAYADKTLADYTQVQQADADEAFAVEDTAG